MPESVGIPPSPPKDLPLEKQGHLFVGSYVSHSSTPNARLELWQTSQFIEMPVHGLGRTQPIVLIVATETIEQGAEIRIDFGVLDGSKGERAATPAVEASPNTTAAEAATAGSSLSAAPTSLEETYKGCSKCRYRRGGCTECRNREAKARAKEGEQEAAEVWRRGRTRAPPATDASPIFSLISLEGLVNLGIAERDPDGNISVVQTQGGELREPTKTTKTALAAAAAGMPAPTSPMRRAADAASVVLGASPASAAAQQQCVGAMVPRGPGRPPKVGAESDRVKKLIEQGGCVACLTGRHIRHTCRDIKDHGKPIQRASSSPERKDGGGGADKKAVEGNRKRPAAHILAVSAARWGPIASGRCCGGDDGVVFVAERGKDNRSKKQRTAEELGRVVPIWRVRSLLRRRRRRLTVSRAMTSQRRSGGQSAAEHDDCGECNACLDKPKSVVVGFTVRAIGAHPPDENRRSLVAII